MTGEVTDHYALWGKQTERSDKEEYQAVIIQTKPTC